MDPRKNEIRVGIAVIVSIVFLVAGIMWGKGYSLRSSRYHIEVVFNNVGGLERGANVLANGVVKGKVIGIRLAEGKVFVDAAVDKSVTLYSDYHITVESPTVMAGKALSLTPGSKLPPADITAPLVGEAPVGMGEAVAIFQNVGSDLQTTLRDLDTLLVNLNHVAGDTSTRGNLTSLIANASDVAKTTDSWMNENRERLTNSVVQLESTMVIAKKLAQTMESHMGGTMTSIDTVAAKMTDLAISARTTLERINQGQGSIGKALNDSSLYVRLNHAIAEVDSLAVSIRTKGMRQKIVLF